MDKRAYSRLHIEIEGIFVLENGNIVPREFEGIVIDISEGGFKISVDYKQYPILLDSIDNGDVIQFNIPDEYTLFGEERFDVIGGSAKVIRKEIDNENVILGCKFIIHDSELEEYISNRRTSFYMGNMN